MYQIIRTSLNEKNEKIKLSTPHKERVLSHFTIQMLFKATQRASMNPCYVQLIFFAGCIMHVTYSYQHFSAFQMSILPLQFELNLNSFLYFNKNLQSRLLPTSTIIVPCYPPDINQTAYNAGWQAHHHKQLRFFIRVEIKYIKCSITCS